MSRCFFAADYIPGSELLPMLTELLVHTLAEFLLERMAS